MATTPHPPSCVGHPLPLERAVREATVPLPVGEGREKNPARFGGTVKTVPFQNRGALTARFPMKGIGTGKTVPFRHRAEAPQVVLGGSRHVRFLTGRD